MKHLLLYLCFCLLLPINAEAYIPRAQTIIKKMTSNNGRRQYRVAREIVLEAQDKQIKAKEVWTIAFGDKMKVDVSSLDANDPWAFSILYSGKNRKTTSASGKVKTFKKSADFFEPLFHDRSHRSLTRRLVSYRFIPKWVPDSPAPTVDDEGKTIMTPEPFVHLEPSEGSVAYTLGAVSSQDGEKNPTKLWIEQDSFLIAKGRLPSSAEFTNRNFQRYSGGLKLPGEQTITWNDRVARVKVLSVSPIKTKKKDWKLESKKASSMPSEPIIKEFYSRFR